VFQTPVDIDLTGREAGSRDDRGDVASVMDVGRLVSRCGDRHQRPPISTGVLAWFTFKVARISQREILIEQRRLEVSQRPIVLPDSLAPKGQTIGDVTEELVLVNAGPGAALNVSCKLEWQSPASGDCTEATAAVNIQPAGSHRLLLTPPGRLGWKRVKVWITCDDLAGGKWETVFEAVADARRRGEAELTVTAPKLLPARREHDRLAYPPRVLAWLESGSIPGAPGMSEAFGHLLEGAAGAS
jgi:hypothetical protein